MPNRSASTAWPASWQAVIRRHKAGVLRGMMKMIPVQRVVAGQVEKLRPLLIQLIKAPFQSLTRAANLVDDTLRPIEVFALSLDGPIRGRTCDDVAKTADLVSKLHELRSVARAAALVICRRLRESFPEDASSRWHHTRELRADDPYLIGPPSLSLCACRVCVSLYGHAPV